MCRARLVVQRSFISGINMSIELLQEKLLAFIEATKDAERAGQLNDGAGPAIWIQIVRQECRSVVAFCLHFNARSVSRASALEQCQSVIGRALGGERVNGRDELIALH